MSSSTPDSSEVGGAGRSVHPGRLHLYLGYAAGVGKTYRMLEDAQELQRNGTDIAVGYFEPHGRKDTMAKTIGLEMIPTRASSHGGATFQEMDTDAILNRHPAICVVDELAHTNVPGSQRAKRWEDVQVLLDAGIDVMTNMNIQHLESLNDHILRITGIRVRETVPDWFIKSASEVVMVDATTGALMNRLKRGVIYAPEKADRALPELLQGIDAGRASRAGPASNSARGQVTGKALRFLNRRKPFSRECTSAGTASGSHSDLRYLQAINRDVDQAWPKDGGLPGSRLFRRLCIAETEARWLQRNGCDRNTSELAEESPY